jgi:hypothetical protein
MGKLQDRTYDIKYNSLSKSIPEETGPLPNQYNTWSVEDRKETARDQKRPDEDRSPSLEDQKASLEDRNSSEDVVHFRLSRQAPSTQQQSTGKSFHENSEFQNSEKEKMPVLNYKSRINVPVSFQTKPISEKNLDTVNVQNSKTIADGKFDEFDLNSKNEAEPPTSPQRKCWDTEIAINSEPCIAVSESNYHILDQNDDRLAGNLETEEKPEGIRNPNPTGSDSSAGQSEGDAYLVMGDVNKSPDEGSGLLPVEEDNDTPKKGLALFIGDENTISDNDVSICRSFSKQEILIIIKMFVHCYHRLNNLIHVSIVLPVFFRGYEAH